MRAFLHDRAAATPLPCHRAEGLGASMTLHLSVFVLLSGMPLSPRGGPGPTLAVTFVSQSELASNEASTTDAAAPPITETPAEGPDAGGTITEFPLALDDFAFDVAKVEDAPDLFPFLTDPLTFLDET